MSVTVSNSLEIDYFYINRCLVFKRLNLLSDIRSAAQRVLQQSSDKSLKQNIQWTVATLPERSAEVPGRTGQHIFLSIFDGGKLNLEPAQTLMQSPEGREILQNEANSLQVMLDELFEIEQELKDVLKS